MLNFNIVLTDECFSFGMLFSFRILDDQKLSLYYIKNPDK